MAVFTGIGALVGGTLLAGTAAGVTGGALLGAGVGMTAATAFQSAKADKANAAYSRDVAEANEQIALDNARDVELRGRQAVFDQRRAVARNLASTRAATAASGVVVDDAGSTGADVVRSMNEAGELDVMRLRNNIEREKRRALVQASSYEAQAGQFDLQRRSINPFRSAVAAGLGATTSGVTGQVTGDLLFGS